MQTNTDVSRREVGKVAWRNVINDLVDSEREDLEDLRVLRRRLTNAEDLRLVAQLFDRKAERVIELTILLRYRDREKEKIDGNTNANGGE